MVPAKPYIGHSTGRSQAHGCASPPSILFINPVPEELADLAEGGTCVRVSGNGLHFRGGVAPASGGIDEGECPLAIEDIPTLGPWALDPGSDCGASVVPASLAPEPAAEQSFEEFVQQEAECLTQLHRHCVKGTEPFRIEALAVLQLLVRPPPALPKHSAAPRHLVANALLPPAQKAKISKLQARVTASLAPTAANEAVTKSAARPAVGYSGTQGHAAPSQVRAYMREVAMFFVSCLYRSSCRD